MSYRLPGEKFDMSPWNRQMLSSLFRKGKKCESWQWTRAPPHSMKHTKSLQLQRLLSPAFQRNVTFTSTTSCVFNKLILEKWDEKGRKMANGRERYWANSKKKKELEGWRLTYCHIVLWPTHTSAFLPYMLDVLKKMCFRPHKHISPTTAPHCPWLWPSVSAPRVVYHHLKKKKEQKKTRYKRKSFILAWCSSSPPPPSERLKSRVF
jgi:hypothetical protein